MDRKHAIKVKPWTFPKDKDGNRIAGWFIGNHGTEGKQVFFVTPNIRGMGILTNHSIEPNGEVNASVLVKGNGYDDKPAEYHEFVILDGWDSNYRKIAGQGEPIRQNV